MPLPFLLDEKGTVANALPQSLQVFMIVLTIKKYFPWQDILNFHGIRF